MNEMIKRKKDEGFTLIELMIVIAVIGILAVVLVPKVGTVKTAAKSAGMDTNLRMVQAYTQANIGRFTTDPSYQVNAAAFMASLTTDFPISGNSENTMANPFTGSLGAVNYQTSTTNTKAAIMYYVPVLLDKVATDAVWLTSNLANYKGQIIMSFSQNPDNARGFNVILYPRDQNGNPIKDKIVTITP